MIKVTGHEKKELQALFPHLKRQGKFIRTCKNKSNRSTYYLSYDKDAVRYLAGLPKVFRDSYTKQIVVKVKGSEAPNLDAIREYYQRICFELQYLNGQIGSPVSGEYFFGVPNTALIRNIQAEIDYLRKVRKDIIKDI